MQRLLLIILVLISAKASSFSQTNTGRKSLTDMQIKEIIGVLDLKDENKKKKFEEIYRNYTRELRETRKKSADLQKIDTANLSDNRADSIIRINFEASREAVAVKEKYYAEFKTVLTPKQILTVYRTDIGTMRRIQSEWQQRTWKKRTDN